MDDPRAEAFWDDVFASGKSAWVVAHPLEHFLGVLGCAGPFQKDLDAARAVLDIGPGHGAALAAATGRRIAVEISAVNRLALERQGFEVLAPEAFGALDREVDLAWSTSCFPHCPPEMQGWLLVCTHRALRPGGVFYLEHVMQRPGFADCAEALRLPAGRYVLDPARLAWPGPYTWARRDLGPDCPLFSWVARCEKL